MRIDLLFGFLGSGKTTLAKRILEEWGPKEQLALIVNEFGDVGVDGAVLEGNDIDIVELSSGCLCCTLKGSLLNAIEEMRSKAPIDHIVIEATGVAEPEEMLATFSDPTFKEKYELGPITTVIDAPKYSKIKRALGPFYTAQIEKADMLVLNKVDLGDSETLDGAKEEVRDLNPDAVIRFSERGDIDIAEIMQGPSSRVALRYVGAGDDHHDHDHGHDHDHDHDHRHAPADSFVIDIDGDISKQGLTDFFAAAPEDLWRAKGFMTVDGTPSLIQFAMGELEVTNADARDKDYLVMIGKDLDAAALRSDFATKARQGEAA